MRYCSNCGDLILNDGTCVNCDRIYPSREALEAARPVRDELEADVIAELELRALNDELAAATLHAWRRGTPFRQLLLNLVGILLDERMRLTGVTAQELEREGLPVIVSALAIGPTDGK